MLQNAEDTFGGDSSYEQSAKIWSGSDMAVRLQQAGCGPADLPSIVVSLIHFLSLFFVHVILSVVAKYEAVQIWQ